VRKLKEAVEGDILIHGSGRLVNSLMPHNLIDEYHLMVYPIVLGAGERLFSDESTPTSLRLIDTAKAGDCAILTYQP
jgi:dihydrofolate reductase